MVEIKENIGIIRFLTRIFISNSQVSSRRVGGFITLIALLFAIFFKYDLEYVKILALLVFGFFALTTTSNIFQPKQSEDNNDVNINKG